MAYTFVLPDKAGGGQLRQRLRPEHTDYPGSVARARRYTSSSVHAFVNPWPQKVGFAP